MWSIREEVLHAARVGHILIDLKSKFDKIPYIYLSKCGLIHD